MEISLISVRMDCKCIADLLKLQRSNLLQLVAFGASASFIDSSAIIAVGHLTWQLEKQNLVNKVPEKLRQIGIH